ncbi:OTU domain-containing protein [Plantactinospora sp. KBS50]|uniref:OTU domain-containing protein n=1 Tax=Plantactinospora sp. KBS50 TaxID=2024580 RepID=UPI0018DF92B3|nr:OTU domain-containing protein [Plantactinospora sp. KBS50]
MEVRRLLAPGNLHVVAVPTPAVPTPAVPTPTGSAGAGSAGVDAPAAGSGAAVPEPGGATALPPLAMAPPSSPPSASAEVAEVAETAGHSGRTVPVAPGVRRPRRPDEPDGLLGGATGFEVEFGGYVLEFAPGVTPADRLVLFRVPGVLWGTYDRQRGARVLEIATEPMAVLPGETNRADARRALDTADLVRRLLAAVIERVPLASVFRSQDGFAGVPDQVWIRPRVDVRAVDMFVQFTIGVPLHGLVAPLELVARESYAAPPARHLRDGLDFAGALALRYLSCVLGREVPRFALRFLSDVAGLDELRGYLAVVYTQVVAVLDHGTRPRQTRWISKNYTAVAARTSLSGMRAGLPDDARRYLSEDHDNISAMLLAAFRRAVGVELTDAELLDLPLFNPAAGTVSTYLRSALMPPGPGNPRVNQADALDVGANMLDLDDNGGRLDVPQAVLEVRHFHAPGLDQTRLGRHLATFHRLIRIENDRPAARAQQPSALRGRVLAQIARSAPRVPVLPVIDPLRTALIETPELAACWLNGDAHRRHTRMNDEAGLSLLELVAAAMAGEDFVPLLRGGAQVAASYAARLNWVSGQAGDSTGGILAESRDRWSRVAWSLDQYGSALIGRNSEVPSSLELSEGDPNRLTPEQTATLGALNLHARWTAPDGDCWFSAVLAAARDVESPSPEIARLALLDPTGLRRYLSAQIDRNPRIEQMLRTAATSPDDYARFREDLLTPGQWAHHLFDYLLAHAGELLGVVIHVHGRSPSAPPPAGPTVLHLVLGINHYLPALRNPPPDGKPQDGR